MEIDLKTKIEGTIAIIAALLVLFCAMWDPRISVGVAVVALVGLGVYQIVKKGK